MRLVLRLNRLLTYHFNLGVLLCSCCILNLNALVAQETVNTSVFFESLFGQFEGDVRLTGTDVGSQASSDSFKAPVIEEYEFRTETNDFDLDDQQYLIRLSPTTKSIRKAQENLFKTYTDKPREDGQSIQFKMIEEAYDYWVNSYIISEKSTIYDALQETLNDKKSIVEKLLMENDFDLSDYFEVDNEIKELLIKQVTLSQTAHLYQSPFQLSDVSYSYIDLIDVQGIKSYALGFNPADITTTLKDEEYEYDKILLEKELDLEIAESKQILRFAEISYSGPHNDPFREKVSFGVGLRLPWDGGNRLKIHELKYKLDNIDLGRTNDVNELFVNASRAKFELLNLIKKHEQIVDLREKQAEESQQFIDVIANNEGFNPVHALEVKEQIIKSQIEIIDSLEEIYKSYISLLRESFVMYRAPFQNYLL